MPFLNLWNVGIGLSAFVLLARSDSIWMMKLTFFFYSSVLDEDTLWIRMLIICLFRRFIKPIVRWSWNSFSLDFLGNAMKMDLRRSYISSLSSVFLSILKLSKILRISIPIWFCYFIHRGQCFSYFAFITTGLSILLCCMFLSIVLEAFFDIFLLS